MQYITIKVAKTKLFFLNVGLFFSEMARKRLLSNSSDEGFSLMIPTDDIRSEFPGLNEFDRMEAGPSSVPNESQPTSSNEDVNNTDITGQGVSHEVSDSQSTPSSNEESEEDFFDPETHSFRHKKHKRLRVKFQDFRSEFQRNEDNNRSPPPSISPYDLSPALSPNVAHENSEDIFKNRSFIVRLRQVQHRTNYRFNVSDHLFDLTFETRTSNKQYLLKDLFELIHEALDLALTTP